jgi:[CysO sulfur-carrier protein]-S-L-cysteine hydrolase
MNLNLDPGLLEEIVAHAKASYPREACGLLAGRNNTASRFISMENTRFSPTEYEMDPQELVRQLRSIRESGEALIAIYHSHPAGPLRPSKRDVERSHYPDSAYLIVSLEDPERPETAAFRIIEGEVLDIEVHVIV